MAATTISEPGGLLSLLKAQSEVRIDPKYPLRSYLASATRIKEMAEKADRREEHAAAYVGYRKVAGLLKVVVDHPDFKEMARKKQSDYYKYNDLKARVLPITHRCRELEEILHKADAVFINDTSGTPNSPGTLSVQDMLAAMPLELSPMGSATDRPKTAFVPATLHTADGSAVNAQSKLHDSSLSQNASKYARGPPAVPPVSSKPAYVASPTTPSVQTASSLSVPSTPVPSAHVITKTSLTDLDAPHRSFGSGLSDSVAHEDPRSTRPTPSPTSAKSAAEDELAASVPGHSHRISGSLKARMNALYSAGLNAPAERGEKPTGQQNLRHPRRDSVTVDNADVQPAPAPPLANAIGELSERPESAPVAGIVASNGRVHFDTSDSPIKTSVAPTGNTAAVAGSIQSNSTAMMQRSSTTQQTPTPVESPSRSSFEQRFPDLDSQPGFLNGSSPLRWSPSSPRFTQQEALAASQDDITKAISQRSTVPKPFHPAPVGPLGLPSQPEKSESHQPSLPRVNGVSRRDPAARPSRGPLPKLPPGPSLPNISATSITPPELWRFVETALGEQTRQYSVLLLDVRSRREHESGRIHGETVCIEPFTLSTNSTAFSIANSLIVCPDSEQQRFARRSGYDLIVLYDRTSRDLPRISELHSTTRSRPINGAPPSLYGPSLGIGTLSSTSVDQDSRALTILASAIYELNFSDEANRLKRSPLVLKGGWEAWVREVGEKGINRQASIGFSQPTVPASLSRNTTLDTKEAEYQSMLTNRHTHSISEDMRVSNGEHYDPKRAHRKAVMSGDGYITGPSTTVGDGAEVVQGYSATSIAIPPVAVHRTGPASPYEAYPTPSVQTSMQNVNARNESHYFEKSAQGGSNVVQLPAFPNSAMMNGSALSNHSIDYPTLQNRHRTEESSPLSNGLSAVQVPQPVLARLPSSSFIAPTGAQSFQLLQNASYLTNPAHGAFPKQLYAFGDGTIGLTGLKNLGNTCYMSSVIQCLSATIPLARFLKEGSYKRAVNKSNPLGTKGVLADTVAQLIQSLWSQQYSFLAPVTFREAICRFAPQFRGSDQHDSQEFLAFLLDGLHEDLNLVVQKPPPIEFTPEREAELEALPTQIAAEREWNIYLRRDDSIIVRLLQGKGISQVTLGQCLTLFTQPEVLDGNDAWNCPKCKRPRRATKELTISRLPAILLIHLKRFSFTPPFTTRIDSQVSFPIRGLDMTSYMPAALDPATKKQYISAAGSVLDDLPPPIYDLHAVSNHFGSLSSGHYTAFVKNRGEWFELNDQKIIPTTESNVALAGKSSYTLWFSRRIA